VAHPIDGNRVVRRRLQIGQQPAGRNRADLRVEQLLTGDDGLHARQREGRRGVHLRHAGVGVRAAHHGRMQHARQHDIVRVLTRPGEEPRILHPLDALADLLFVSHGDSS
jgi:hypothetical protein